MKQLLLFLLPVSVVWSQDVVLRTRWSADTVKVGTPVILRLEVELPEQAVPHFPELMPEDHDMEILDWHLEPYAVEYRFSFWSPGEVILPGIPVKYLLADGTENTIQSDSLRVYVSSTLTGAEGDIREIKGMVPLSLTNRWVTGAGVAVILMLLVLIVLLWRRRDPWGSVRRSDILSLDPAENARVAMANLRRKRYRLSQAEAYYLELSRIFRRYLEGRYLFRALEMTTSEILRQLPREIDDEGVRHKIQEILERSDLVKFAGMQPSDVDFSRDADYIEEIVALTDRRIVDLTVHDGMGVEARTRGYDETGTING